MELVTLILPLMMCSSTLDTAVGRHVYKEGHDEPEQTGC